MKLKSLKLFDYRCFDALDIDFNPQLTVLVSENGAGKTSILDAIAVAFGPFVDAFDEAVGKNFDVSDIRNWYKVRETATHVIEYATGGVRLEASGFIPDNMICSSDAEQCQLLTWRRTLNGPTKAKTTIKDAKELIEYGKQLQKSIRTTGKQVILPLLSYYGTGRLCQQKELIYKKNITRTSRTIGYTDCLDSSSNYNALVEWFRYWNFNAKEERIKAHEMGRRATLTEFDGYIRSVRNAVNICLKPADCENIEYSFTHDALVVHHKQLGQLPVELLSDGVRNMICMVADIAFRATKLNGHLGADAAARTPGIVLIDDVDMNLHPKWQQVVLQNFICAFPDMQFIVTTHSQQVLTSVDNSCIRMLRKTINSDYRP